MKPVNLADTCTFKLLGYNPCREKVLVGALFLFDINRRSTYNPAPGLFQTEDDCMRRLFRIFTLALLFASLPACSLLEVKIDSQTTPLSQKELNMRLLTREYGAQFFKETEKSADEIAVLTENDSQGPTYAMLWKIYAVEGMQQAIYQVSPQAGLVDSWVFTLQVRDYFEHGEGKNLFYTHQHIAQATSSQLALRIEDLAANVLNKKSFKQMAEFVQSYAKQHPFTGHSFTRTPSFHAWLKAQGIDESEAVSTLGTMPEAIGDLSDRLSNMSSISPKLLTWKAELIARNSDLDGKQLGETLENINQTSVKFQDFVTNNPKYMRVLASEMGDVLQPLLDDFDVKTDAKLTTLTNERIALEAMVERERIAIGQMVTLEREKIAQDIDVIAQNVVKQAITQVKNMLASILVYLILFVLVIFFAPFGMGYLLGKRRGASQ